MSLLVPLLEFNQDTTQVKSTHGLVVIETPHRGAPWHDLGITLLLISTLDLSGELTQCVSPAKFSATAGKFSGYPCSILFGSCIPLMYA